MEEVDSTNNYLWELSEKENLPDFYSVSTDFQTKGKGQDDNKWESAKGQNILISIIVNPDFLLAEDAYQISRWVSISIIEYLKSKGLDKLKIKWPNDIYVGRKKLAGILIQNAMAGVNLTKSMIGIGLNVNQLKFTSNAPNPVSVKQITGSSYGIYKEIIVLKGILQKNYSKLKQDPQHFIKTYYHLLYQLNEKCFYLIGNKVVQGEIQGVNQFGQLILAQHEGVFEYDVKEIKFL
ncbi:MAG: biotin--[acetyl-CoA-carboxylase] ligase [Bacteroidales bacterium]|nr:biotin--[acetyl-CoA-carboxylase] ligase [Bacteroidales bacterium]